MLYSSGWEKLVPPEGASRLAAPVDHRTVRAVTSAQVDLNDMAAENAQWHRGSPFWSVDGRYSGDSHALELEGTRALPMRVPLFCSLAWQDT